MLRRMLIEISITDDFDAAQAWWLNLKTTHPKIGIIDAATDAAQEYANNVIDLYNTVGKKSE